VELTGGCQGFATKYMDWPEELIVGRTVKNGSRIIRWVLFLDNVMFTRTSVKENHVGNGNENVTNQKV